MGFGAVLGMVWSPWVPISVVILVGMFAFRRTCFLAVPIYFLIVAVPASAHRLTIASEFERVTNFKAVPVDLTQIDPPTALVIFDSGGVRRNQVRDHIINGTLERLVIATHKTRRRIPGEKEYEFDLLGYKFEDWRRVPASDCETKEIDLDSFLNSYDDAPCMRKVETVFPLPSSALARFRWVRDNTRNDQVVFGRLQTLENDKARLLPLLERKQITKRFRAYQFYPRFSFMEVVSKLNRNTRPENNLWGNPGLPIGSLWATSAPVSMNGLLDEVAPLPQASLPPQDQGDQPSRTEKPSTPWKAKINQRYPAINAQRSRQRNPPELKNPEKRLAEVNDRYAKLEAMTFEDPETARSFQRALEPISFQLCENGYVSAPIAQMAGRYAPDITRLGRTPFSEKYRRAKACEEKLPLNLLDIFTKASKDQTNQLLKNRAINDLKKQSDEMKQQARHDFRCKENNASTAWMCFGVRLDRDVSMTLTTVADTERYAKIPEINVILNNGRAKTLLRMVRNRSRQKLDSKHIAILNEMLAQNRREFEFELGGRFYQTYRLTDSHERRLRDILVWLEKFDALDLKIEDARRRSPDEFSNYVPQP